MFKPFAAAFLLFVAPAFGGDDAPPAPTVPAGGFTPPIQATLPPMTPAQFSAAVDEAVKKSMATMPPLPTAQTAAATASPQAFTQPAPVIQYATAPATQPQTVSYLVHPGLFKRACGKIGEKMVHLAEPKVRTMTITPAQTIPISTVTTAATPTAYTPPVAPTPSAPAAFTLPAPTKASPQR